MNTLVDYLEKLKAHLSDKERWEECFENNKRSGYSSGSLENDIGNLYDGQTMNYRVGYDCLARAIIDIHGEDIRNHPTYSSSPRFPEEMVNLPDLDDVRIVNTFGKFKCHENLMKVLDSAIRYAKVYIFS